MGADVLIRAHLKVIDACHPMPLSDFRLPQRVEAFDDILHAVLERRREYGDDLELHAQAADRAHGIGKVVRTLKHIAVVELGIRRQSVALPALDQIALKRPGRNRTSTDRRCGDACIQRL
jgi:hypothetical protein